ncbi:MAG: hypothetical protein D6679_00615, partial [Candidatus Hydrogenedentota bacterium]
MRTFPPRRGLILRFFLFFSLAVVAIPSNAAITEFGVSGDFNSWADPPTSLPYLFVSEGGGDFFTIYKIPSDFGTGAQNFKFRVNFGAGFQWRGDGGSISQTQTSAEGTFDVPNYSGASNISLTLSENGYYYMYAYDDGADGIVKTRGGRVRTDGKNFSSASSDAYREWPSYAKLGVDGGITFYTYWDTTYLYIAVSGVDLASVGTSGDFFVAIDTDGMGRGLYQSSNWDSRRHHLPFAADRLLCIENSNYALVRFADYSLPSLDWSDGVGGGYGTGGDSYVATSFSEFRIAWSVLGGIPTNLRIMAWYQGTDLNNQSVNASFPVENPASGTDADEYFTHYYYWSNINGSSKPREDSRIVANPRIVINDVNYQSYDPGSGTEEDDYIELYNASGTSRSIGNYTLRDMEGHYDITIPAGVTLAAGGRIVLHPGVGTNGYIDKNGTKHYYGNLTGSASDWFATGTDYAGALSLYNSTTLSASTLVDFVMFNNSNSGWNTTLDDTATANGIWVADTTVKVVSTKVDNPIFLKNDGADSDYAINDWVVARSTQQVNGLTNKGVENPGGKNRVFQNKNITSLGFFESDYSTPLSDYAVQIGDTIYVKLVTSQTNPTGASGRIDAIEILIWSNAGGTIPVSLFETGNNTKEFRGRFELSRDTTSAGAELLKVKAGDSVHARLYTFSGDSAGVYVGPDTSLPNAWYLNNNSTAGDSFTTAIGNDANDGLSPAFPKLTLDDVLPRLSPGDTLYIDSGTFNRATQITLDGTGSAGGETGVWIIGVDSSGSIINFTGAVDLLVNKIDRLHFRDLGIKGANVGLKLDSSDSTSVERVYINAPANVGLLLTNSDSCTISQVAVVNGGNHGINLQTNSNFNSISHCLVDNATFSGILFNANADTNTITNCRSINNGNHGISSDLSLFTRIENCTISDNSQYGVFITNASHRAQISSNEISGNGLDGIRIEANNAVVRYNRSRFNNGAGVWVFSGSGAKVNENEFDSNATYSARFQVAPSSFKKNNITPEPNQLNRVRIEVSGIDFRRNWWGTTDSGEIRHSIDSANVTFTADFMPFRLGRVDTDAGSDTVAPSAPTGVTASALGPTSIRVSWNAVLTDEETDGNPVNLNGYNIYRSEVEDTSWWKKVGSVGAGVTHYDDAGLTTGTKYYYRVTAFDNTSPDSNESYYSSIVSATTSSTAGPNAWYINDAVHDADDSFTTAVGSDANDGTDPSTPFLHIDSAISQLT